MNFMGTFLVVAKETLTGEANSSASSSIANKTTLVGVGLSGSSFLGLGDLSVNEWLAISGFVLAAFGAIANVLINFYFKTRDDARAQEEHEAKMRASLK